MDHKLDIGGLESLCADHIKESKEAQVKLLVLY